MYITHRHAVDAVAARAAGHDVGHAMAIGYAGYVVGPAAWVVDDLGLGDAFLARIPFRASDGGWRIGHFERKMPEGYAAMAASGVPAFGEPELDAAFRAVTLLTRGSLWAPERWEAIWELHTGVHAPAFAKLAGGVDPGPWPVP